MGYLTTHVLDTAHGEPGAGIKVELYSIGRERTRITAFETNSDGRADGPILEGEAFKTGIWELVFFVGPYFTRKGSVVADPAFLDEVILRFGISAEDQHYHVPLLVSPWSYSTYRGS